MLKALDFRTNASDSELQCHTYGMESKQEQSLRGTAGILAGLAPDWCRLKMVNY